MKQQLHRLLDAAASFGGAEIVLSERHYDGDLRADFDEWAIAHLTNMPRAYVYEHTTKGDVFPSTIVAVDIGGVRTFTLYIGARQDAAVGSIVEDLRNVGAV